MGKTLGNFIKNLRNARGVSAQSLSKILEIDRAYILEIEMGKAVATPDQLGKIAFALKCPISDLQCCIEEDKRINAENNLINCVNVVNDFIGRSKDKYGAHNPLIRDLESLMYNHNLTYERIQRKRVLIGMEYDIEAPQKNIIENKIQCKQCDSIISSEHVHDMKWCECGSVAVDGGKMYLKRCSKIDDGYIDLSITNI